MEIYEIYEKLREIGDEHYEKSVKGVEREQLEKETITLKNAFIKLYEEYSDIITRDSNDISSLIKINKRLKEDNERLRKMAQQIYETFKKKALKYIVNSKMDTKDLNLFKEIFSTYLK